MPMASDKAFPSRVLNKLRLQRSKRGMHLPAQATVKPLHHPKALPWKHWYFICPEEQERKYSKLQTELFRPVGPHQCSAETWERLTQMQAFMPSPVLPALWARKHHACQSAQTTEVASLANGQRQGTPKQSAQQTPAADIQTRDTSARAGDSETIAPP